MDEIKAFIESYGLECIKTYNIYPMYVFKYKDTELEFTKMTVDYLLYEKKYDHHFVVRIENGKNFYLSLNSDNTGKIKININNVDEFFSLENSYQELDNYLDTMKIDRNEIKNTEWYTNLIILFNIFGKKITKTKSSNSRI